MLCVPSILFASSFLFKIKIPGLQGLTFDHHFASLLLDCLLWCCRRALQSLEWKLKSVICSFFVYPSVHLDCVCFFKLLYLWAVEKLLFSSFVFWLLAVVELKKTTRARKNKIIKVCLSFSITCVVSCRVVVHSKHSCSNLQLRFGKKLVVASFVNSNRLQFEDSCH